MGYRFTDEEKAEFLDQLQQEGSLEDYFEYLDLLRDSGATNMYGAGAYLEEEFALDHREAGAVLSEWMRTYGTRLDAGEVVGKRAKAAVE